MFFEKKGVKLAANIFAPGTLQPLRLAPNMFAPTFSYLLIVFALANIHSSMTSAPIYPRMWPTLGY